jgi:hypothetical protein
VWRGSHPRCSRVASDESQIPPIHDAPKDLQRSECVVAYWTSVVLFEDPESPDSRRLHARTEDPNLCDVRRFAQRVEIVYDMPPSNIVSVLVAVPRDGAFAGARLARTTYWIQPGGCEIEVSIPDRGSAH